MKGNDWRRFDDLELSPILEACLSAFHEMGFHGTSVRDIAARVGVTVPALYYHHGSKQGMLVALLDRSISDLDVRLTSAVASALDGPWSELANFVDCTVRFMCYRTRMAHLDREISYLDEEARAQYAVPRKRIELRLRRIIEHGNEAAEFDVEYPETCALALLGMYQGIANWYDPEGPLGAVDMVQRYTDFSLSAVGASSELRQKAREHVRAHDEHAP